MTGDVLLPQSACVQGFAVAIVVTAAVAGCLFYFWGYANGGDRNYRRGYAAAWEPAHQAGWIKGISDAGVLDRLVALDEATSGLQQDAEFRQAAGMRRWRAAVEAWNAEGRRWA